MAEPSERSARQQRRQKERRKILSLSSLFAVAFILSFSGALYVTWLVYPLGDTAASPAVLRAEYKADYIYMVSQGYALDGDWAQAQARLDKLDDPMIADTALALLERALREGRPPDAIRNLARLAEQLGAEGGTLALFAPTPVLGSEPAVLPTPTVAIVGELDNEIDESVAQSTVSPEITAVPEVIPTATVPPLETETADSNGNTSEIEAEPALYRLLSQTDICEEDTSSSSIKVVVVDSTLTEVRGIEVLLSWDNGSDRALTGFKRNEGAGYADFTIDPDISYTVSMGDGDGEVGGLQGGSCADGTGVIHWLLRYQALSPAN